MVLRLTGTAEYRRSSQRKQIQVGQHLVYGVSAELVEVALGEWEIASMRVVQASACSRWARHTLHGLAATAMGYCLIPQVIRLSVHRQLRRGGPRADGT
ncbi:hypothetical protein ASE41_20890 [Streptomyces sp. Root264]|nr:hypothetical protein ASE41_20890 [Streptomyces sp. Root264]